MIIELEGEELGEGGRELEPTENRGSPPGMGVGENGERALGGLTRQGDVFLGREGETQVPETLKGRAVEEKSGFFEHGVGSLLIKPEILPIVRKPKFPTST